MNTTAAIQKRGQLTIPEKINWKKMWKGIALARSFKGKRGNLSKFIIEDRRSPNR